MLSSLQQAEAEDGQSLVQTALTYLLTAGEVKDSQAFLKTVETHLSAETGASIMTIAKQIEAKGRMEGRVEGRMEGRAEGEIEAKKKIAVKLLKQKLSLETISQITELSLEEIQRLIETSKTSH